MVNKIGGGQQHSIQMLISMSFEFHPAINVMHIHLPDIIMAKPPSLSPPKET